MKTGERKLLTDARNELVKARVTKSIKDQVVAEAGRRGQSPAEAVRQAISEWLRKAEQKAA